MAMLVTAGVWLLFVLATLRPPFRRGALGFAVFVLTMTFNEIPLILLVVFCLSIAITDRPESLPALAAAAILVGTTITGLVWLQVRARTARATLAAVLAGEPERSSAAARSGRRDEPPATPWLRGILLPFQRHARGVERMRNLRYGPARAHRVDVYRGPSPAGGRPLLVHLHGGGFAQGGKSREGVTLLNQLAAHGWLCLSADYRLRSAGAHPQSLIDAKRVIAWARERAPEYGADPSRVFVVGSSAGGHLAVCAALTSDLAELQPGFETADTTVAGVVVLYGYLGARTAAASSSPVRLARADAPPMLIIHGSHDTAVPIRSAEAVAGTLRDASRNPVLFAELPHTQHSFDLFASVRARVAANAIEVFLDGVRSGGASSPP